MTRLRRNHSKQGSGGGSMIIRVTLFAIALIAGLYYLWKHSDSLFKPKDNAFGIEYNVPVSQDISDRFYLPTSTTGEVVHHKHYSLSYSEEHEQAEWVAYELTMKSLQVPNVKRAKRFIPDYDVTTRSAYHGDYTGSGYTRGHMAPAGDMAFSEEAMKESFFMSNMSPQLRALNNGIWKELEENVRDWAYTNKRLYIVTGPLLNRPIIKTVGKNKVSVPSAFYKILLDLDRPSQKAIGFIIPNKRCTQPLMDYAVNIDQIEAETGIDFFPELMEDRLEDRLEKEFNPGDWKVSQKRYRLRVDKWNYQ